MQKGIDRDSHITLAHGNGGRRMRELISDIFVRHLGNAALDTRCDAATLPFPHDQLIFTTDGFTVEPLEFPGGNIGSLAVHGTVNDLAVSGARPHYLSLNAFIEEGLAIAQLERIVISMAAAAKACGVQIVTGDTKVVRRGEGSGLYLATSGIGTKTTTQTLAMSQIEVDDVIIISGPIGDHGTAVMLAREQFGLQGNLQSDATSVLPITKALLAFDGLRFMRDPTRGGLATVLHEIHRETKLGIHLKQDQIPVRDEVAAVCEILGYDPLYLACEGRVVAVIKSSQSEAALSALRKLSGGCDAAIIGTLNNTLSYVMLETPLGGQRIIEELEDDPLPRIC
jgi:hydrogenase expression/formation protein HypE